MNTNGSCDSSGPAGDISNRFSGKGMSKELAKRHALAQDICA